MRRWAVQTDFVWAIPFKASSLYSTADCCNAGGPCQCQPGAPNVACQCGLSECTQGTSSGAGGK